MYKKLQQRKQGGFTIIEVLIVLAIAGLIMVVVFLAVPALQRSSRNNALSTSVNNVFTGVNNFVANNNGTLPAASAAAAPASGVVTIQGVAGSNTETVKVDSSIATVQVDAGATPITTASAVGTVQIITGSRAKCNATASGISGTGSNRSIAVLYVAESGSGRIVKCLE
jgi:prepilin-type N-terminal cleavage/methylation domain-containing protein